MKPESTIARMGRAIRRLDAAIAAHAAGLITGGELRDIRAEVADSIRIAGRCSR